MILLPSHATAVHSARLQREHGRAMALHTHAIYLLCLLTSTACTVLLFRGYSRNGFPLLFWSGVCFVFLSANNLLVYLDVLILPDLDLRLLRLASNLVAVTVLLYGFLWEVE